MSSVAAPTVGYSRFPQETSKVMVCICSRHRFTVRPREEVFITSHLWIYLLMIPAASASKFLRHRNKPAVILLGILYGKDSVFKVDILCFQEACLRGTQTARINHPVKQRHDEMAVKPFADIMALIGFTKECPSFKVHPIDKTEFLKSAESFLIYLFCCPVSTISTGLVDIVNALIRMDDFRPALAEDTGVAL